MVDLKAVEAFFFEAMITKSWASGGEKIVIPGMPNYKGIEYQRDNFRLLDCWSVTPGSSKSSGHKTIWVNDVPVWIMYYGGQYDKRAIEFLKKALLGAYQDRQFFGGRGPLVFTEGPLRYANYPERGNDFSHFGGRESIFTWDEGGNLGWHEYKGMALV